LIKRLTKTTTHQGAAYVPPVAAKFREQRELPIRLGSRSVFYFFNKACWLWNTLAISLVIDALILGFAVELPFSVQSTRKFEALAYLFLLLGLFGFASDYVTALLHRARAVHASLLQKTQGYAHWGIGLALFVLIAEFVWKLEQFGLYVFGAALVVGYKSYTSLKQGIAAHKEKRDLIARDKTVLLDVLNEEQFVLLSAPFISARLACLLFCLSSMHQSNQVFEAFTAALLFLVLHPQKTQFLGTCPRCARWTPRTLTHLGYCPVCAREKFQLSQSQ
jgi:uncharacterized membrane protein